MEKDRGINAFRSRDSVPIEQFENAPAAMMQSVDEMAEQNARFEREWGGHNGPYEKERCFETRFGPGGSTLSKTDDSCC